MGKKSLTPQQIQQAAQLLERKVSIRTVAHFMHTSIPSLKKALGIWDTDVKVMDDGNRIQMVNGKMVILGTVESEKKQKKLAKKI